MRILLSEGSSSSARQAIYALGRNHHQIDLVDPSRWCQCRFSSRVRRRIPCPPISRDPIGYAKKIASLVQSGDYDVLFPTHEQVYLFSKFRDFFQRHVGLAVPSFDVLRRIQSKSEFVVLMDELRLPIPASRVVKTKADLFEHDQFPCFVKLVHSTASLGVQKVDTPEELRSTIERFEKSMLWKVGDSIVIQQPARGRQAVATAVFQEGRLVALACADILKTGIGGGPTLRVSAVHPPVRTHLETLGRELNWHGPIAIEYFYDSATEQVQYIEANPRIGETSNPRLAGVPLCETVVRISVGEHVDPLLEATPGIVSHSGFVVLIADAYNGASRIELLQRLVDHWLKRGDYGTCPSEMTRVREDRLSWIPATAVALGLLASPRSAVRLATGTVENYSLPQSAADVIDNLPDDALSSSMLPQETPG